MELKENLHLMYGLKKDFSRVRYHSKEQAQANFALGVPSILAPAETTLIKRVIGVAILLQIFAFSLKCFCRNR
jgi:hypothetical protein